MISFVGAGPGAPDLITLRGKRLLEEADVIIYAGSLINPELLRYAKKEAVLYNSAKMTLEELTEVMCRAAGDGLNVVRLHSGEPSIYGAVREQMDCLDRLGIRYQSCPGVSACFGAAAALNLEYTLPGVSQTLIITRMEGRTPVPEEEKIEKLAAHRASMAVYLSSGMLEQLSKKLLEGGYMPDTPAALVYKATWPEEKTVFCTVGTLEEAGTANSIDRSAVVLVGDAVKPENYHRSGLYDPSFSHGFRNSTEDTCLRC